MRLNVNPSSEKFEAGRKELYVDKSNIIATLNSFIGTRNKKNVCVSRPRRFGKSTTAEMLIAYYSKSADSKHLFDDLKIAKDPSF